MIVPAPLDDSLRTAGEGSTPELLPWLYVAAVALALAGAGLLLLRRRRSRRGPGGRASDLDVLADIGRAILGTPLDLGQLTDMIYQQAGQIVDTSIFQLGLFDGDRYRLLIWVVDGVTLPRREFRLTPDSLGIVGWMRQSGRSVLVRDFEAERDALPAKPRYTSASPPRSAAFVPLLAGQTVIGAMAVQSRQPNAFGDEDMRLLSIVANQAAAALEKTRLFEQAQRRAAQLQRLTEISQQISALQPLPDLYRQVVELVAVKFDEYQASFFERDGEALVLRATTRADWSDEPPAILVGEGVVGRAALSGEPAVAQELPDYAPDAPAGPPAPTHGELAVPVEIEGRLMGVLCVRSPGEAPFDDIAISLFQSLAAQLAMAILEGQTYQAEQRRVEHLAAIARASRAVTSTLELGELLDEVLDLVNESFGYRRAYVFLLHEDRLVFQAGTGGPAARWAIEGFSHPLEGPGLIPLVGRTRQPIVVGDVATHADYAPAPGLQDTCSEMAVPMVMGSQLLGVLDVQSERPHAFTADDLQTVGTLADTLAIAVRNARLFAAERRRRQLAEILRDISTALTSTAALDDVLDLILAGLASVVSYDAASILLVNETGELCLRAARGVPGADEAQGMPLDVQLFRPGEPIPATVAFTEVDLRGHYHDLLALPEPHACLAGVLALQGEHLGYLVVDYAGRTRFPEDDVELIAAFASQAAVAIANARLYAAQRDQAWVSTTLLEVAEAMARASDLTDVLETAVQLTPMLAGADRCAVLLAEAGGETFVLRAHHVASADWSAPSSSHAFRADSWPALADLLHTGEPAVVAPGDADDAVPEVLRGFLDGVAVMLPLLAMGRVAGVLVVGQSAGDPPFTVDRIRLIGGIASQAALAIEGAILHESQQEEAWLNVVLLQVAEAVAASPSLETSLEAVGRLTRMLVGVDAVAVYQWSAAHQVFRLSHVQGLSAAASSALLRERIPPGELGVDPLASDASASERPLPGHLAQEFGAGRCMVWPLRARGGLLGALLVEYTPATGRRLKILSGVAHQLALAIDNARLADEVAVQQRLEREMELARDIQASFMPSACPQYPGWEVCTLWQAARHVGGDFYDFIPLRPHQGAERWGIVIADVADKGVPAALFMALSRTLLRTVAISRVSPATTLARVNDLILADARTDLFVTIFYGVWEPGTGRFSYAIGGHYPPLWVRAGTVQTLPGRGVALGVFEEARFQEHEVYLAPGDTLLMYTDGLTDAVNLHDEPFGLRRVEQQLGRAHTASAAEIQEALTVAVREHVGAMEAFDDMTLVVLKRLDAPGG